MASVLRIACAALLAGCAVAQPRATLVETAGETFVASVVVTEPPYGADPTGASDCTVPLQRALDDAAGLGGGVVYLPPGRYLVGGTLKLGYAVSLVGGGSGPEAGADETLLVAAGGPGDAPLLDATRAESGIIGLSIWYPNQRPGDVTAYPFAIRLSMGQIRDVTLYNAFNGVELVAANACAIQELRGTVLRRGLLAPESTEFSWVHDVHFANGYWREAAARLGPGPMAPDEVEALDAFTHRHLVGLELGRLDGMAIYRYRAEDARVAVRIEKDAHANQHPVFGFGGVAGGLQGPVEEFGWDPWYYGMHYADVDAVPEAAGRAYTFARVPGPARRGEGSLLNVREAPFGAVGDGAADDTAAIRAALERAGRGGGGTVYLPQGVYRVSEPVTVPSGVELRGALGVGKARSFRETCSLACVTGGGTAEPESAPAFLTLQARSGVRGVEIVYPEQAYDASAIVPYPFTVRGQGEGVWVADVTLVNSTLGVDLATARCDEHRVIGLWGLAFEKGLVVGGGSRGGRIERTAFSFGPWSESGRLAGRTTPEGNRAIAEYCEAHSTHYVFGSCEGEEGWGLVGFDPAVHFRFAADGGAGCTGARFWHTMLDVAHSSNIAADAGSDIEFLGLFATGGGGDPTRNWLEVDPGFQGPLRVYAKTVQQSFLNHPYRFAAGQVELWDPPSLTSGRPATCVPDSPGGRPEASVDRDWRTCWQAAPERALEVDLGSVREIRRFGVETARLSEDMAASIGEVELWVSVDGAAFALAGRLQVGAAGWADRPLEPTTARYVQLRVADATDARIASFDVYGVGD